jgi:16S rRNA processing protein RimM
VNTSHSNNSRVDPPPGSVKIGYIRRAHGIRGGVIVRVLGDETDQFMPGRVLLADHGRLPEVIIVSARPHKDGLLATVESIVDRNQAEDLVGTSLYIDAEDRRHLEDDEYWPEQLVGLNAVTTEGETLGEVRDIVAGSAQDRLVIDTPDGDREVPFVSAIVVSVDLDGGSVVIDPPAGLF